MKKYSEKEIAAVRRRQADKLIAEIESGKELSQNVQAMIEGWLIASDNDTVIEEVLSAYFERESAKPLDKDYAAENFPKFAMKHFDVKSKEEADRMLVDVRSRTRVNEKGELYLLPKQESDQQEQTHVQQPIQKLAPQRISLTRRLAFRVAAVLIPLFAIGGAVWLSLDKTGIVETGQYVADAATVSVTADQDKTVTLPDGTQVKLKQGAALTYAEQFADNRMVALEGEAYFTVTRDEAHPFTVSNGDMKLTVLGTEFNVKTGDETEVILTTGKVEITNGEQTATLEPGQRAILSQNTKSISLDEIGEGELNRLRGVNLSFDGQTLDEAFRIMGGYFGVKIIVKQGVNLSDQVIINFKDEITLDKALQLLQLTNQTFDYIIDGNTVTIAKK